MSIKFYLGASGSGKSKKLHKDMLELAKVNPKKQFFMVVPDQFTMDTQMQMVKESDNQGIMNIDVQSFNRLAHRIFEEVGLPELPSLDDTGKNLILKRIVQEHRNELALLGKNINKIGYIHEIKSILSEFMQYGVGVEDIEKMRELLAGKGNLQGKLGDLIILYKAFLEALENKYITREEKLTLLSQTIPKSNLLKNSIIAFDGFTGFTPIQEDVLREMLLCADEVWFSFILDGREKSNVLDGEQKLYNLSKQSIRRLRKLADEEHIEELDSVILFNDVEPRFANKELAFLEKNIFRYPIKHYSDAPKNIHIFGTGDPKAEIKQCFLEIKRLINEKDYAYRDFAIILGDENTYHEHARILAKQLELPIYLDQTRGVLLNPLTEMVKASETVVIKNFETESVFRYLRSGLGLFEELEVDELENYCLAVGVRNKKQWFDRFTYFSSEIDSQEKLERVETLRKRIVELYKPLLEQGKTAKEKTLALYEFLMAHNTEERLETRADEFLENGDLEKHKEYTQVYRLCMSVWEQIYELIPEEELSNKEYLEILEAGFEELRVGTIPLGVDRVTIGDMERTRLSNVKVLFLLGANEGSIPRSGDKKSILGNMDRELLKNNGMELAPGPREQMYTQRLYLYMNMTQPSDMLYVSYSRMDNEKKTRMPSYLIGIIKSLFPKIKEEYPEKKDEYSSIYSKNQGLALLSEKLQQYAIAGGTPQDEEKLSALLSMYEKDKDYSQIAYRILGAAFIKYEQGLLDKSIARLLYNGDMRGSVTRLETFSECAKKYFLSYGLSLKERDEYSFESDKMGSMLHSVLEHFSTKLADKGLSWETFSKNDATNLINEIIEIEASKYPVLYSTATLGYTLEVLKRVLLRAVMTMQEQIKGGSFTPGGYEISFGKESNLKSTNIELGDDAKMIFNGKIDRVDVSQNQNKDEVYLKIIDYKSSAKDFSMDKLYYGLQLQLVMYMKVAMELEAQKHSENTEIIPAAMLYYALEDPMVKLAINSGEEKIKEEINKELRPMGIINAKDEVLDHLASNREELTRKYRIKINSKGEISGVMPNEDINILFEYGQHIMEKLGKRIMAGEIANNPIVYGNPEEKGIDACKYCDYRDVCGFDTKICGYEKQYLEQTKQQDVVISMMKKELGLEE